MRFSVFHSPISETYVVDDSLHEEVFKGIDDYGNACRFANLLNDLFEESERLNGKIEFLEAHNKALIHTNDELKKDLHKYEKILECEYWDCEED